MDTDTEWVEDSELSPSLRAKLFALKTCRNRCLAHAGDKDALEIAKPVLKMFATILQHAGSFTAEADDEWVFVVHDYRPRWLTSRSVKIKARLRLQAAVSSLRLASIPLLFAEIQAYFVPLAITIQDPCYQIRMSFLDKTIAQLSRGKLNPSYNVIPFLAVHDPESDVISKVSPLYRYRRLQSY